MKKIFQFISALALLTIISTGCSDWDDHFNGQEITSTDVTIYDGDMVSYMKSTSDVSQFSALFQESGIFDSTFVDKEYTFIVCNDQVFGNGATVGNRRLFARYSVADMAISPSMLSDGYGIHTRSGKNVWVYGEGTAMRLDDFSIQKVVRTSNGYIYYISGVLPIRSSVYDYFLQLGDDYSRFKEIVGKFEERFFDREHSAVVGVNEAGQTVYDSIFYPRNTLMDRYTADGIEYWNMHDESYMTTMFIPSNDQIDQALQNALDSIPLWLNREATDADREKFERWIVEACFVNRLLSNQEVSSDAEDFQCADGYLMNIDRQADITTYDKVEAAWWRPSVQTVDLGSKVNLSNGAAYYTTNFKIPNHVIIYRVKSRFYELWSELDDDERAQYFRWGHWTSPDIIYDAQGEFFLSATLPTIYYHVLTAIPDEESATDSLHCTLDYDGLVCTYDQRGNPSGVLECNLPAGEYYLRMGFVHSLSYTLDIYFNDEPVVKDLAMNAHGANYHFDRSGASDIPHYGIWETGYPEGYDPNDWIEISENASAYDTDGYTMGIVNLKHSGNFHITIDSFDNAYLYDASQGRTKNNKTQLMMYHWCLRPTHNNY